MDNSGKKTPKSGAERSREYRKKKKASDSTYQAKENARIEKLRQKRIELMSDNDKLLFRMKAANRSKMYRDNKRKESLAGKSTGADTLIISPTLFKPHTMSQSTLGAVKRCADKLPNSPHKGKHTILKIASEPSTKPQHLAINTDIIIHDMRAKLKEKSIDQTVVTEPTTLIREVLNGMSDKVVVNLPGSETLQKNINRYPEALGSANTSLPQQQCPAPGITDVGQPVTVSDTDQVVTAVGSNDERQNSLHLFDPVEISVFNVGQGLRPFREVDQPKQSVKQTDMPISRVSQLNRWSSQVMSRHQQWRKEPTGSSVGNRRLSLVTDRDSMAPSSKVAKSDANVIPHTEESTVFPQFTITDTQKEKRTLSVPNHQVAVMSNLLTMWKAGRLCDSYISNGCTKIMVHKMVLGAVCPKVLPILHSTSSSSIPKLTFPSSISKEALLAFAEYMYSGILDLNHNILIQLKTIAQRLDMKDFEQLCSNELHKAKAACALSAVGEPLLTEPCSLSGLLSSSTQRTDPGHSQNTTLSPFLNAFENISSSNSSNSKETVPTNNLVTVGDPFSSSSVPILRSDLATTTADQVIDIKIELESDNETILSPNSQQLKMEPCSPLRRDQHGILEESLIDFENIASNTGVGLQLAPPAGSSSSGRGDGLPISYSANHYRSQLNPALPEVIHITTLRNSKDNQLPGGNRGEGRADSSNGASNRGDLQLVPITSVTNYCTIPSETSSIDNLVSHNSGLVTIPSNMATNTDLSPTTSNFSPYPVGLFTADDIKIIPALQENYA